MNYRPVLIPALAVIFGVLIGYYLRPSGREVNPVLEKQRELYEQTVKCVASLPPLKQAFGHYFWDSGDLRDTGTIRRHPEAIQMLADTRAEVWKVLYADRIYFGKRTAREVDNLLAGLEQSHRAWWEWNEKDFTPLLEVMVLEGKLKERWQ